MVVDVLTELGLSRESGQWGQEGKTHDSFSKSFSVKFPCPKLRVNHPLAQPLSSPLKLSPSTFFGS